MATKITSIGRILTSRNAVNKNIKRVKCKPSKVASKNTYTVEQVENMADNLMKKDSSLRIVEAMRQAELTLAKRLRLAV